MDGHDARNMLLSLENEEISEVGSKLNSVKDKKHKVIVKYPN